MTTSKPSFSAIQQPFVQGTTLIEASAGTGKTFSISYLVLRLVVEQGLDIDEILTVTFTKAATEELRERIREQLYKARQAFEQGSDDETLMAWIELRQAQDDVEQDKARLNQALSNIDQAGIFTIHGFCQRVLTEFPLESQQAFKVEMSENLSELKQQVVQDFWRAQVYELPEHRAKGLMDVLDSPTQLFEWLNSVGDDEVVLVPTPQPLEDVWAQMEQAGFKLNQWLTAQGEFAKHWLKSHQDILKGEGLEVLEKWSTLYTRMLSEAGLNQLWHGSKVKANRKAELWNEFVDEHQPPVISATEFQQAQSNLEASFKQACLDYYRAELNKRQDEQGLMGFHDLVMRLADVLKGEGQHIKQAIQQRFKAALIDEFQDTDMDQWRIFSDFFATGEHYLYLIGDPKQAIYKFRGADIETYLAAANSAQTQLTLAYNWRSKPNLVEATNALFKQVDAPFQMEGLAFHPVKAAVKYKDDETIDTQPLEAWTWPASVQIGKGHTEAEEALVLSNVCQDILAQLNSGERTPGEFAVLVRNHARAAKYQQTLLDQGVPAVVKAKESVFHSDEAKSLWRLMRSVLQPNRLSYAKEALSEAMMGLSAQSLFEATQTDSELFENWMLAVQTAHETWLKKGLLPAMQGLLKSQGVLAKLAQFSNAERRITNLLHVLEILQNKALEDQLTPIQTLLALEGLMTENSSEATELRLESDAKAVQIVTIHASKGLQYPVVYCPDLYKAKSLSHQSKSLKVKQDGQWLASADKTGKEALKAAAEADLKAEDIRLSYVALTRAEQRCIVVMPPQFSGLAPLESSLSALLPEGVPKHANIAQVEMQLSGDLPLYTAEVTQLKASRLQSFERSMKYTYRLTSFSRLTKNTPKDVDERKSDDEKEAENASNLVEKPSIESILPKGTHFGNVLHDVFEHNDFQGLTKGLNEESVLALCKRYGVFEMIEEEGLKPQAFKDFEALIMNAATAEIEGFALQDLQPHQLLKEMAFYMSLGESSTVALNQAMHEEGANIPYQSLGYRELVGHMNGFVDLIAEFDGRFYVMDYKSNQLADYSQTTMRKAMEHSNFGLQGVIYTLALHRYLQNRLPDYDYEQHMGGVRYLFVRGMTPDRPGEGVFAYNPSQALIERLDSLLGASND